MRLGRNVSGRDILREELAKLMRGSPVVDSPHWPPQDEGDGLAWCLWVELGKPDLPEKRPPEGPVNYLLSLTLAEIFGGHGAGEQGGRQRRRSRNRDDL
jgi:hypothetical protein